MYLFLVYGFGLLSALGELHSQLCYTRVYEMLICEPQRSCACIATCFMLHLHHISHTHLRLTSVRLPHRYHNSTVNLVLLSYFPPILSTPPSAVGSIHQIAQHALPSSPVIFAAAHSLWCGDSCPLYRIVVSATA